MLVVNITNKTSSVLVTPFGPVPPGLTARFTVRKPNAEAIVEALSANSRGKYVVSWERVTETETEPVISENMSRKELVEIYKEKFGKSPGRMSKAKILQAVLAE